MQDYDADSSFASGQVAVKQRARLSRALASCMVNRRDRPREFNLISPRAGDPRQMNGLPQRLFHQVEGVEQNADSH
jgi:hypothetical protein